MPIYEEFAPIYAQGGYTNYSEKMARLLPEALGRLGKGHRKILDLACGEGTFARTAAELGYEVTGIDLSPRMIEIAREKTEEERVSFFQGDMRQLDYEEEFDLVTCWFDGLNYLLEEEDILHTLAGVRKALREQGTFIFDINSLYQLKENWMEDPCTVQRDSAEVFELHRTSFNSRKNIATLKITAFLRGEEGWRRFDEEHKERGYSLEEIRKYCLQSGLRELDAWDDWETFTDPDERSGRIWFAWEKPKGKKRKAGRKNYE